MFVNGGSVATSTGVASIQCLLAVYSRNSSGYLAPVLRDLSWALFGMLLGLGMSLFLSPRVAFIALALAVGILAWRGSVELADVGDRNGILIGLTVAVIAWAITRAVLQDESPALSYSLKALTPAEAVAFRPRIADGETLYRFTVRNDSNQDVQSLHIAVDVPAALIEGPTIIDQTLAENVRLKPAFFVMTKTSPDGHVESVPGLINRAIVEASYFPPHASIDVTLHTRAAIECTSKDASGERYGAVDVKRRHRYYGTDVEDSEAFAVTRTAPDLELLDVDRKLPSGTSSICFPPMEGLQLQLGWGFRMEMDGD
jgi:hypothetical protein